MGLVLLLPPVEEVPVFPSDSLPSPPSSRQSAPPPPSTCSRSSGWVWAWPLQTRALCHSVPPPLPLTLPPPPLSLSAYFLCPAHLAQCCVIYSSLGDMWSLCWIPRTPGSQCFWRRRKRRNKENNLTQPADYQDILFDLRTRRFCKKRLSTLNRNDSNLIQIQVWCEILSAFESCHCWRCNSL